MTPAEAYQKAMEALENARREYQDKLGSIENLERQVMEYRQDILVLEDNLTNTKRELNQELEQTKRELQESQMQQEANLETRIKKINFLEDKLNGQVKRDFIAWNTTERRSDPIHMKTNIPKKSNVMYRILVEGYNYGAQKAINSDIVGYTWKNAEDIIHQQANNYAPGAIISQYYSSDGFVVIKLTTTDTYYLGFAASAWFTNPTGTGFDITAQVYHQASDL